MEENKCQNKNEKNPNENKKKNIYEESIDETFMLGNPTGMQVNATRTTQRKDQKLELDTRPDISETDPFKRRPLLGRSPPQQRRGSTGSLNLNLALEDHNWTSLTVDLEESSRNIKRKRNDSSEIKKNMTEEQVLFRQKIDREYCMHRDLLNKITKEVEVLNKVTKEIPNTKKEIKNAIGMLDAYIKRIPSTMNFIPEIIEELKEKVEEREDKETVDGSTQTINRQAIERQKLIDEIDIELEKDLSVEELQEIVKINWPQEVFKQCQLIKGEILQKEDEDLIIITKGVENKETKIMNNIKYTNPQIQKIMDDGKIKPGKMMCSVTLNETMGEDFEERNNKRFIYVIVTEDGGNTIEDKANLMTNLDKILNNIRKNARTNTTCITTKCVEERSVRKVVEYFGRKNDIQISMYNTKEGENVAQENQMEEVKKRKVKNEDTIIL